jgi:hypothetical protein
MKNSDGMRKKVPWIVLAALPTVFAVGQSPSQSSQSSQPSSSPAEAQQQQKEQSVGDAAKKTQKDKPKPKKVYTEEDLSSIPGHGVSVVGDETPPGAGAAGTKKADGKPKSNVAAMSGQDEDYWRGKARVILDEIAATDQAIAKTKDEIKKYGSDGFDATSGLKNNVIYIDNRSSKLQQLEKRKADLEKRMDQLQEEGRKAGAEPSWFR